MSKSRHYTCLTCGHRVNFSDRCELADLRAKLSASEAEVARLMQEVEAAHGVIGAAKEMREFLPMGSLLTAPLALHSRRFDAAVEYLKAKEGK